MQLLHSFSFYFRVINTNLDFFDTMTIFSGTSHAGNYQWKCKLELFLSSITVRASASRVVSVYKEALFLMQVLFRLYNNILM